MKAIRNITGMKEQCFKCVLKKCVLNSVPIYRHCVVNTEFRCVKSVC